MFILGLTEMPEEDKEIPLTHHLEDPNCNNIFQ